MGLKKALKNFLIGKKGSYTGKTTSDLLVESLNSAGGGGDDFIVTFSFSESEEVEGEIPDKTFEEMLQAWNGGKRIKFYIESMKVLADANPEIEYTSGDGNIIGFAATWILPFSSDAVSMFCTCCAVDSENNVNSVSNEIRFSQ